MTHKIRNTNEEYKKYYLISCLTVAFNSITAFQSKFVMTANAFAAFCAINKTTTEKMKANEMEINFTHPSKNVLRGEPQ
jgi:hypothetical protein